MEVREAVASRKSIRAFDPERPVSQSVLREIMEKALRAPSWGNTQPWGFAIAGGKPLDQIKAECLELFRKGTESHPEITMPAEWNKEQFSRYQDLGRSLFGALGIAREDKNGRNAYYEEMVHCFGAPKMIYLHIHKDFNPYALMDGGVIMQTIALLAVEAGLGTCFLAFSVLYPDVIRKYASIPDDRTIVVGMAIGYPNQEHPSNKFRSLRGKPEEFIRFTNANVQKP